MKTFRLFVYYGGADTVCCVATAVFAYSAMPASQVALARVLLGDCQPQGVHPL
jgi:hypothetical protein